MPSILFICTGNLYRSPLAAACFLKELQRRNISEGWIIESAGTWTVAGQILPKETLIIASNFGLPLISTVTQSVSAELLRKFDRIIVMERGHLEALNTEFPFVKGRLHLISEVVDGFAYDILDPISTGQEILTFASEFIKFIVRGFDSIYQLAHDRL